MKTTTIAEYLFVISGRFGFHIGLQFEDLEASSRTYAAMAPKFVARTVFENKAFSADTSRIRMTMIASRTALLDTKVRAKTGSNCTTQRQTATKPNSAFFKRPSENLV
jgi:hypothetical protein